MSLLLYKNFLDLAWLEFARQLLSCSSSTRTRLELEKKLTKLARARSKFKSDARSNSTPNNYNGGGPESAKTGPESAKTGPVYILLL